MACNACQTRAAPPGGREILTAEVMKGAWRCNKLLARKFNLNVKLTLKFMIDFIIYK